MTSLSISLIFFLPIFGWIFPFFLVWKLFFHYYPSLTMWERACKVWTCDTSKPNFSIAGLGLHERPLLYSISSPYGNVRKDCLSPRPWGLLPPKIQRDSKEESDKAFGGLSTSFRAFHQCRQWNITDPAPELIWKEGIQEMRTKGDPKSWWLIIQDIVLGLHGLNF